MWKPKSILLGLMLLAIVTACDNASNTASGTQGRPDNAIDVSIIYAPESDLYMPQVIDDFNAAYGQRQESRHRPEPGQRRASYLGHRPVRLLRHGDAGHRQCHHRPQ